MTEQEAIDQLTKIYDRQDTPERDLEEDHAEADRVLCALLESLGYSKVVHAWQVVEKWYG